jgi:hypothetical protein
MVGSGQDQVPRLDPQASATLETGATPEGLARLSLTTERLLRYGNVAVATVTTASST